MYRYRFVYERRHDSLMVHDMTPRVRLGWACSRVRLGWACSRADFVGDLKFRELLQECLFDGATFSIFGAFLP
jgi:hypothetical protein